MQRIIAEATFTAAPAHPVQEYLLDRAAGSTVTLPAALGTGFRYRFRVGTTVTSNDNIIQAASSSDVMAGVVIGAADAGSTVNGWEAASTSDTITLDGSTTGGIRGDFIELVDMKEGVWAVSGIIQQTGTEATPFSAAV
jgi:hypothetical protein